MTVWWDRFPSVLRHSLCSIICCIYRASALRIISLILRRFRHISTFGRKIASFSILRVYQINAAAEMWDPVAISRSAVQFCENLFVRGRKQDSLLQVKAPWCARSLHAFYHAREIRPTWRDVTLPLGWVSEVRDRILATSSAVSCATVRRQFHRSKPFRADSFCSVLFITQHWQVSSWVSFSSLLSSRVNPLTPTVATSVHSDIYLAFSHFVHILAFWQALYE